MWMLYEVEIIPRFYIYVSDANDMFNLLCSKKKKKIVDNSEYQGESQGEGKGEREG